MKLLISPRLSVGRTAQRRTLYEARRSSPTYPPSPTSTCRRRPFSSTSTNLSKQPTHTTPKPQQQTESSLSHKIRLLMRRIPHPVAIVTASFLPSASSSTNTSPKPLPRGMTVSSFNTVTLHPSPIITFNVRQPSETLAALQSSGRFLVHLLSPTAPMARLARNFSKGNDNVELDRFEFMEHEIEEEFLMIPRLNRRRNNHDNEGMIHHDNTAEEDFTFVLECEYLPDKSVQVYDHMIVLGNVRKIIAPRGANGMGEGRRHTKEDFCLMYADTRFWGMGDETS